MSVLCLCVEMHTWVQVSVETGGLRCLWNQLQMVVSRPMWVLRMQPGSSTRAVSALSGWPISSALFQLFMLFMFVVRFQIFSSPWTLVILSGFKNLSRFQGACHFRKGERGRHSGPRQVFMFSVMQTKPLAVLHLIMKFCLLHSYG